MTQASDRLRGNPRIAPTAHFTAQAWHKAGFAGAKRFDTRTGRLAFAAVDLALRPLRLTRRPAGYFIDFLWLRHQWLGERLRQLAPGTVIEIGAGLSSRGLVLADRQPGITYLELDLPGMVAAKRACLGNTALPDNYRLASLDLLAEDFAARAWRLARPGAGPCVVLTEGVCDYLNFAEKRRAWRNIAALLACAGGGYYLQEVHSRARLRALGLPADLAVTALGSLTGRGFEKRLFATPEQAIGLLQDCGFESVQALDPAGLDPGPFAVPPTGRYFDLVQAQVGADPSRTRQGLGNGVTLTSSSGPGSNVT